MQYLERKDLLMAGQMSPPSSYTRTGHEVVQQLQTPEAQGGSWVGMARCRVLKSVRRLLRLPRMPRACVVFAGRVQIKAVCSKSLCCALGAPIPSHDRCIMPLLPFSALTTSQPRQPSDIGGRNAPRLMAQLGQFATPEVCARAGFHDHQHRGCRPKNSSTCARLSCLQVTTCPEGSAP
jgi:hypothetical protein